MAALNTQPASTRALFAQRRTQVTRALGSIERQLLYAAACAGLGAFSIHSYCQADVIDPGVIDNVEYLGSNPLWIIHGAPLTFGAALGLVAYSIVLGFVKLFKQGNVELRPTAPTPLPPLPVAVKPAAVDVSVATVAAMPDFGTTTEEDPPGLFLSPTDPVTKETTLEVGGQFGYTKIGEWSIIGILGEGGYGRVYKGRQMDMLSTEMVPKTVAIKVIELPEGEEEETLERVAREVKNLSALRDPFIMGYSGVERARIVKDGKTREVVIIYMEYVTGKNLAEVVNGRTNKKLEVDEALEIAINICRALQAAHKQGIIHRDIKPQNVMLVNPNDPDDRRIKLLDLGLSVQITDQRLTQDGKIYGTPIYGCPDVLRELKSEIDPATGQKYELDHRADMYSLGIVLYACLAGKPPFKGRNPMTTWLAHLNTELPDIRPALDPKIPDKQKTAIWALLKKVLDKDRAKRPLDYGQFIQLLQKVRQLTP